MPKFNMSAHEPTIRSISGRYASISEIAAAERIDRGYVGSILRLTLLAPDIVEAVIDGRQSEGLILPILLEPFPEWGRQRVKFVVVDGPLVHTATDNRYRRWKPAPALPETHRRPEAAESFPQVGQHAQRSTNH